MSIFCAALLVVLRADFEWANLVGWESENSESPMAYFLILGLMSSGRRSLKIIAKVLLGVFLATSKLKSGAQIGHVLNDHA
jgi:hypothetical protein